MDNGRWGEARNLFSNAQMQIEIFTANIDVYNILTKVSSDWNLKSKH